MTSPDVRLREIEARAKAAQDGRWPATPYQLARLLALSTATLLFVLQSRRDVLWLVGELKHARETIGNCPTCGEQVEARACL